VSQQEIQFENTEQSESKRYDSGYGAFPHYSNDYEFIPFSQKIGGQEEQTARESAHLREHSILDQHIRYTYGQRTMADAYCRLVNMMKCNKR
jgi:hypothetical protein